MRWPPVLTRASRRCHRSTFFTGCLAAVRQPLAFQPWIHSVMPLRTYSLSRYSVTAQGRGRADSASITAVNSMRLLVVPSAPPNNAFSVGPERSSTPQPPGPGLPLQAPSVYISTWFTLCSRVCGCGSWPSWCASPRVACGASPARARRQRLLSIEVAAWAAPGLAGGGWIRKRHRGGSALAAAAPGGVEQAHAVHPFDRHQKIGGAQDRPPFFAQGVHPAKALQPLGVAHGGTITAKTGGFDLETQQPQPVAQAPVADELAHFRQVRRAMTQVPVPTGAPLAQAPQTGRVQAADDHAPFRHQHPLHLAQC